MRSADVKLDPVIELLEQQKQELMARIQAEKGASHETIALKSQQSFRLEKNGLFCHREQIWKRLAKQMRKSNYHS